MTLNEYQAKARKTATYQEDFAIPYLILGLNGEAGEVADKLKRVYRGEYSDAKAPALLKGIAMELGDVLWYVANLAHELGLGLDAVAKANIDKLRDRQDRGVLQGSGDTR